MVTELKSIDYGYRLSIPLNEPLKLVVKRLKADYNLNISALVRQLLKDELGHRDMEQNVKIEEGLK